MGLSTGLEYAAERAANVDELSPLCAACARAGGLYATHTRFRDAGSEDAVAEAIATATQTDVRLQVSHLVPRNGMEATHTCIEHVERAAARASTSRSTCTRASSARRSSRRRSLRALLRGDGVGTPAWKRDAVEAMRSYTSILSAGADWSRVVLLDNELWPDYARKDIASIAADRSQAPARRSATFLLRPGRSGA